MKLNTKVIQDTIDWLRGGAKHTVIDKDGEAVSQIDGFDMTEGVRIDCGTTCCIAGAICQFGLTVDNTRTAIPYKQEWQRANENSDIKRLPWVTVSTRAHELLGLEIPSDRELSPPLDPLFYLHRDTSYSGVIGGVTPVAAADILERVMDAVVAAEEEGRDYTANDTEEVIDDYIEEHQADSV